MGEAARVEAMMGSAVIVLESAVAKRRSDWQDVLIRAPKPVKNKLVQLFELLVGADEAHKAAELNLDLAEPWSVTDVWPERFGIQEYARTVITERTRQRAEAKLAVIRALPEPPKGIEHDEAGRLLAALLITRHADADVSSLCPSKILFPRYPSIPMEAAARLVLGADPMELKPEELRADELEGWLHAGMPPGLSEWVACPFWSRIYGEEDECKINSMKHARWLERRCADTEVGQLMASKSHLAAVTEKDITDVEDTLRDVFERVIRRLEIALAFEPAAE